MKHLVKISIFTGLIICLRMFSACECEDLSPVVPENTPDTFHVTLAGGNIDNSIIYFSINFNLPIDTTSIVPGKTVFVEGMTPLEVFMSSNYIVLSGAGSQCSNNRCRVKITLKGSGTDVVKSSTGQILDGDSDGSKGGDFVVEQEVD